MTSATDFSIKTIVPCDEPFQDASFYSPGAVANVWKGDRLIEIDVAGDLDISNNTTRIWKSEDLRSAFPDGNLDLDDWNLENNRWFELFIVNGGHSYVVDEVAYDYDEAIAFAKSLIEDDELWED